MGQTRSSGKSQEVSTFGHYYSLLVSINTFQNRFNIYSDQNQTRTITNLPQTKFRFKRVRDNVGSNLATRGRFLRFMSFLEFTRKHVTCHVGGDTDFIYHILEHRQKQRYEPQKHQLCQRIQTSIY